GRGRRRRRESRTGSAVLDNPAARAPDFQIPGSPPWKVGDPKQADHRSQDWCMRPVV
ncbi:hypothetical protein NDU88_008191, partial [Pleurodeles waltl]